MDDNWIGAGTLGDGSNTETGSNSWMQDFSTYDSLASYFGNDFSKWGGPGESFYPITPNTDAGDGRSYNYQPGKDWMAKNGYSLGGTIRGSDLYSGLFKGNQNSPVDVRQGDSLDDPNFSIAMSLLGGALSGYVPISAMAGGGMTGAAAQGAAGGWASTGTLKGAAGGAIGGGLSGFNPAQYAGITDPSLAGGLNRAVGGGLGAAATGGNVGQAALSGGVSGAVGGMFKPGGAVDNFSDAFKQFMAPQDQGFDGLMGSGGDMSGQTDVTPSHYYDQNDMGISSAAYSPNNANIENSAQGPQNEGMRQASSFSMPSLPQGVSNFLSNKGGDLASMLYGMYNNRRQQQQLGSQMSTLQGMYGQNSAYAQNMRNTLMAKAAQGGHRSDIGGREVQLQAALAQHAAGLMPTQMQMQQQQQGLQNNNMNMMLQGFNKMGGIKGLQQLFSQNPMTTGDFSRMDRGSGYSTDGG